MTPSSATAPPRTPGSRGRWALRDYPAVLWMALAVLLTLVHPFVPDARWLMVHLLLLGALTHSVMVWSTHFTQALLKTRPGLDDRPVQTRRLVLLLGGTALTVLSIPLAQWWLTVAGATLVAVAVVWHGVQLARRLRSALPGRFRVTVRYYLAASACLPVGAALGATMARGLGDALQARVLLAHITLNVLGWVGLTVTGTLLTLWPTMLRTRIDPRAERRATLALPVLLLAIVLVVAGGLGGVRALALVGLVLYLAGLLLWASAALSPVLRVRPREFAPASVGLALVWWIVGLVLLLVRLAGARTWAEVADGSGRVTAVLVVGFAAQLLPGALAYLVPSVLGGGKTVVRAGQAWFDRWGTVRLAVINLGLVLCLLPVSSVVRVAVSVLVLLALAAFLPLMLRGIVASARARREVDAARAAGVRPAGATPSPGLAAGDPDRMPGVWSGTQLAAALAALALAVSTALALDPSGAGLTGTTGGEGAADAAVVATGRTTTVQVTARDMRFEPAVVEVPAGDRLVVQVTNADPGSVHDLQLLGRRTPRLGPGESATLDVGVVGADTQGWCTIVGHHQMGMTLDVRVTGGTGQAPGVDTGASSTDGSAGTGAPTATREATRPVIDPAATIEHVVDPVLPPLDGSRVHRLTLTAREVELEVAPGVTQRRWTFDGQVPAPTLHGRVGDRFEITLVNDGTMGHSIDFHAGALAPDEPMRTIAPGERLVYRFTAERAGAWMYHCGTAPASAHIAAGMFGAVVIEPDGLAPVDRQYLLVQSETYLAAGSGQGGAAAADLDTEALAAERPTFVSFNGVAGQYLQQPLTATVGDRVRLWVLDAGPDRPTSFHVIGTQFDTVWSEGAYLLGPRADRTGSQALGLQAAQGGFVETTVREAGHYPVVSHIMVDAERGAKAMLAVTP